MEIVIEIFGCLVVILGCYYIYSHGRLQDAAEKRGFPFEWTFTLVLACVMVMAGCLLVYVGGRTNIRLKKPVVPTIETKVVVAPDSEVKADTTYIYSF